MLSWDGSGIKEYFKEGTEPRQVSPFVTAPETRGPVVSPSPRVDFD
jgi:hypothetical protein